MSFEPPPKPARACRAGDEVQSEQKTGEAEGDKSEAPVAPKKPTRVSIIRPRPRPKSAVIDGQRPAEKSGECSPKEEILKEHISVYCMLT